MKSTECRFRQAFLLLLVVCSAVKAEMPPEWREWNRPVDPFRIAGNVYYVGTVEIASYLIATRDGLILIDSGFLETVPVIQAGVERLGFRMQDIRLLLNNHGHIDHAAGLAELKRTTGAALVASRKESELLARGGRGDFQWGDEFSYEPVIADRIVADGETVELGDVTLTAHLTPGHTKGCTSWTMKVEEQGKNLTVIFMGSMTAPGYRLVNTETYPEIVEDFLNSFRKLRSLKTDVFLSFHASFFKLHEKRKYLQENPAENPFIRRGELQEYLDRAEREFRRELEAQKSRASSP